MSNSFRIEPIGRAGLPLLLDQYRKLRNDPLLPESTEHLQSQLLERESVDLDHSFFAWPADAAVDAPTEALPAASDAATPAGFGLLGVRQRGGKAYASIRALGCSACPASVGPAREGAARPDDCRPALLAAMIDAARTLGALSVTAEGATEADDLATQPPASLLQRAGLWETTPLLGFEATRDEIMAEPVYLQIGLHHIGQEDFAEFEDWLGTGSEAGDSLPWPLQPESFKGTAFPDMTFVLIASGFAGGYMAVTDTQVPRVEALQIWVLPDLRRQQVAKGALQEVLNRYPRVETFLVPPMIPESSTDLISFLQTVGFRPTGARRLMMEVQLAK